ncbi:MAG: hypothetical protein AAF934_10870, partial [Bacteroidota bacterium]
NTLNTLSTDLGNGSAKAIQVVGNTVYTAGYRFSPNDEDDPATFFAPCYWKNGVRVDLDVLELSQSGKAQDIQVVGDYIFIAGFTTNANFTTTPCYWINDTLAELSVIAPDKDGEAKALHIAENNIYIAGYTQNESDVQVPCYWRNELRLDLPFINPTKGGVAEDIYVVGTDIYVAGYTLDDSDLPVPCYWINGNRVDLSLFSGSDTGITQAIAVKDKTVYTVGDSDIFLEEDGVIIADTDFFPFYWINSSPDILPVLESNSTEPEGSAYAIDITENALYISGYSRDSNGVAVPCYWENGIRIDLPVLSLEHDGKAYGIYITED